MWRIWLLPEKLDAELLKAAHKFIKREMRKYPKQGLRILHVKKEDLETTIRSAKIFHEVVESKYRIISMGAPSSRRVIIAKEIICRKLSGPPVNRENKDKQGD